MTRYISNEENLKDMMNLLKDKSKNIQFEAFHVFKVFVANPKKPPVIENILRRTENGWCNFSPTSTTTRTTSNSSTKSNTSCRSSSGCLAASLIFPRVLPLIISLRRSTGQPNAAAAIVSLLILERTKAPSHSLRSLRFPSFRSILQFLVSASPISPSRAS
ncbi:hypothetical protein L7F22_037203 [Adiantum nelumboides]|nr:hypothetical protein [Adiantum nelumboides]